jgi:thiol-disulfide isomerase/thioredoxin
VVLIFTSPDCVHCTELLPQIARWQEENSGKLTVALVSHLGAEENRAKTAEYGLEGSVLLQEDWEVADAYGVDSAPSAVLIRPDGTIGSPLVIGSEHVEALVAQAVGARPAPDAPL